MKIGDKIVCISNQQKEKKLTINKTYTIFDEYNYSARHIKKEYFKIQTDTNEFGYFQTYRFISLCNHRKQKLDKLCSK